jgi:ribonucleoside-diphosphate reductase alpha chain
MYVTINEDTVGACEIFTQLGKSGGCTSSQTEAISRLISIALRSGVNQTVIINQLRGIRCPSPTIVEGGVVLSCADAIAKVLELYNKEKMTDEFSKHEEYSSKFYEIEHQQKKRYTSDFGANLTGACPQCPDCGEMLVFAEGCVICRNCGYSKCF